MANASTKTLQGRENNMVAVILWTEPRLTSWPLFKQLSNMFAGFSQSRSILLLRSLLNMLSYILTLNPNQQDSSNKPFFVFYCLSLYVHYDKCNSLEKVIYQQLICVLKKTQWDEKELQKNGSVMYWSQFSTDLQHMAAPAGLIWIGT